MTKLPVVINYRRKGECRMINQTKQMKLPKTTTIKPHSRRGSTPTLTLTGGWLTHFGFESGTVASIFYGKDVLVLKSFGADVGEFTPHHQTYVVSRPFKNRFLPQLELSGKPLTDFGFHLGDKIQIQILWGFIYLSKTEDS